MSKDTILFDLDGTLLPIDFDVFLHNYFQLLTSDFLDIAAPDRFIKILLKATNEMINNKGEKLNKEVFLDSFFSLIEVSDQSEMMERFNLFYHRKFPLLGKNLKIDYTPARIINYLKKAGYFLVLATNPVFPEVAVKERIKWSGLNPDDFILITHYENMHYCKPDPGFFREILDKIDSSPERCIMVGNDMQEDMIAGRLGMDTYLVKDYLIDRSQGDIRPDWQGTLQELEIHFKKKFNKVFDKNRGMV
jgi:FMN phosphatase YigB (HAD superfamily)